MKADAIYIILESHFPPARHLLKLKVDLLQGEKSKFAEILIEVSTFKTYLNAHEADSHRMPNILQIT